jgi:hypothetical protein
MTRHLLIACLLLAFATAGMAHRDTIIVWNPDGTLERLPPEFQPATLQVKFTRAGEKGLAVDALTLRVAGREVTLPKCITRGIHVPGRDAVRILASWYHDPKTGPPYISIEFFDSDPRATAPKTSRTLFFNLRSARLTSVEIARFAAQELSISYEDVDFRAECSGEDLSAFSEPES